MFLDYVVKIEVEAPTGITNRNNLFQFCWLVDKDDLAELNSPVLVSGTDFVKYFDNQGMIEFGDSLGSKEIFLVNDSNLAVVSDVCFWLIRTTTGSSEETLSNFKGFKIYTDNKISLEAKTYANASYTAFIIDGNTASSPHEILESFLSRSVANLDDMQYKTLQTWQPVLTTELEYLEAFNSNLIFANTPDASTTAVELANLKMGGISWTRLLVGEYVKQQLQTQIKLFIKNSNPKMEVDDYIILEQKGNDLLQIYINQGLIGAEAIFTVDYNQTEADIIQGNLKNIKANLQGLNSLWRAEAVLLS